jgi:hypothetical protein
MLWQREIYPGLPRIGSLLSRPWPSLTELSWFFLRKNIPCNLLVYVYPFTKGFYLTLMSFQLYSNNQGFFSLSLSPLCLCVCACLHARARTCPHWSQCCWMTSSSVIFCSQY